MSIKDTKKTTNGTLAARIERAAQMVYLQGAKECEVAAALGIKPVTLRDWKRRPEWRRAIAALREAQNGIALDRLSLLTDKAVTALDHSLESENPTVRLKAATWVLERQALAGGDDVSTEFELFVRGATGHVD
jgi:transposase-like protein